MLDMFDCGSACSIHLKFAFSLGFYVIFLLLHLNDLIEICENQLVQV